MGSNGRGGIENDIIYYIMSDSKWSLKKEISVGDVLAILLVAFTIIAAYFSLDSRIKIVETSQTNQLIQNNSQSSWLIRIEGKVDRLLEREQSSGYSK